MASWLEHLAERQMLKSRAEGKLENWRARGNPCPTDRARRISCAGKAAGCHPRGNCPVKASGSGVGRQGNAGRKRATARLSDLMMKQAIADEARQTFQKS